jgi:aspartyl/asparaginyl beta-hydroxylase (cupin superfamily)
MAYAKFPNILEAPVINPLEGNWKMIRPPFQVLSEGKFTPWKETVRYSTGSDDFRFHAFGTKVEGNGQRRPKTAETLGQLLSVVKTGFSSSMPGTHVQPHVGCTDSYSGEDGFRERRELNTQVLHMHHGLILPPALTHVGRAIRVGAESSNWEDGSCLEFDDSRQHEALTRTRGALGALSLDFEMERG